MASRRLIYRNKSHYRNPLSLQGMDMLLALFFCTLWFVSLFCYCGPVGIEQASNSPVFSIRRIQHFRGSFLSPGNCCILKPRNLLYCASNQYALLCGAFRINFCNQLKAALPCRNCVPYPIPPQLNYVHPHRLFMAVCSFFTHSMCQMLHSES